jgi:hypothetical protein
MDKKQIGGRVPAFVREGFDRLLLDLREIGCKPTQEDLIAALIHAARDSVASTKELVEEFVKYELEVERSNASSNQGSG